MGVPPFQETSILIFSNHSIPFTQFSELGTWPFRGNGTPLHAAALNGRHAMAELLLAKGAGVHIADCNGDGLRRRGFFMDLNGINTNNQPLLDGILNGMG